MKKRLFSFILTFVLLLGLMPAAMADYTNLSTAVAGQQMDIVLDKNDYSSVALTSGSVPTGCVVESELRDGVYHHYLRGTPMSAGDYTFTLAFSADGTNPSKTVTYSGLIVAATPTVYTADDIRCYQGDDVVIELRASVADYGTLSYKWFYNNYNSNHGGAQISGATGSSYRPSTANTGVTYYYCEVTNTNNGRTATVTTTPISVTVDEAAVSYISVVSMPNRTEYTAGDWLDATGMKVRVVYTNGRTEDITEGFGLYPTELREAGRTEITVDYKGKECTFTVNVKESEKKIANMSIVSKPTKLEYVVGDTLDTEGLKLRVSYTDGTSEDITSGFTCSPTTMTKEGTQAITVTYEGKSTSFTVKVSADDKVKSISVVTPPTKLEYKIGEKIDLTGLKLSVDTGSETKEVTSGFTVSPSSFGKAGEYEVKVLYGGQETTFKVTVVDEAEESPAVSETPASASPTTDANRPAKRSNTLLVVGIIFAILALAALGAYVYVMQRGGGSKRGRRR